MVLTTKYGGGLDWASSPIWIRKPADDADKIATSFDLNAASVGDTIPLAADSDSMGWVAWPNIGFHITQNDASGTNLATTVKVRGETHQGVIVEEEVSLTGDDVQPTANAYRRILSMEVTALANKAASDTLTVGVNNNGAGAAAERLRMGIPPLWGRQADAFAIFREDGTESNSPTGVDFNEETMTFRADNGSASAAWFFAVPVDPVGRSR